MKWNRWNDQMVSLLIELYPVETTAHTAAMLEMSVSAVKYKAKELGLGKLAKSKWMERADHIRSHFNEESFTEIGEKLGVTRVTVSRIASKMGLKRSKHEGYKVSSRVRQKWCVGNEGDGIRSGSHHPNQCNIQPGQGTPTLSPESERLYTQRTEEPDVLYRKHLP